MKKIPEDGHGRPAAGESLDAEENAAWPADEPPEGFADRVMAAWRREEPAPRPASRPVARRATFAVLGTLPFAVAAALWLAGVHPGAVPTGTGHRVVTGGRQSIDLGGRAVAVAESGATLDWTITGGGAARVVQRTGDIFYRVDRGGPFVIETPAGEVAVVGTCFRVEVLDMPINKNSFKAGAIGAALATAAVVSVYEGRVVLAGGGRSVEVGAGESGRLPGAGHAPGKGSGPGGLTLAAVVGEAPAGTATREELVRLTQEQRKRIAELEARLGAGPRPGGGAPGGDEEGGPLRHERFVDIPKEELVAMARRCEVRTDVPPVMGLEVQPLGPRQAEQMGLLPSEAPGFNQALQSEHDRVAAALRALYLEVTGDGKAAQTLSPQAMLQELQDKTPRGATDDARRKLAQERAGLLPPPPSLAGLSAAERTMRLLTSLGDDFEHTLADKIGPARAHDLRSKRDGWGMKMDMVGCPGGGDEE